MNAVDVAEQLIAVGRQLQEMGQRLQQPVVALESFATWGELWIDPMARLSELTAPHVNPQLEPRPSTPSRPSASYRGETRPISPLGPPVSTSDAPREADRVARRGHTPFAEETALAMAGGLPPDVPAIAGPQHTPAPLQTDGVRMTRAPSSLLSILQSNIRPNAQSDVGRLTSQASTTGSAQFATLARSDELLVDNGNRLLNGAAPQTTDDASRSRGVALGVEQDSRSGEKSLSRAASVGGIGARRTRQFSKTGEL